MTGGPAHLRQRVLQNQRGAVVAHVVRRGTGAMFCRLRFRLDVDRGRAPAPERERG
ncbi:hypothetical protein [Streptomyces sp900116325]|uniref:hypothetical protein n=1 Tax=Streptomyces sp. 900116325 TaxID=3154295 RepID=UPI0033ACB182